jgi:hypothetical protein
MQRGPRVVETLPATPGATPVRSAGVATSPPIVSGLFDLIATSALSQR